MMPDDTKRRIKELDADHERTLRILGIDSRESALQAILLEGTVSRPDPDIIAACTEYLEKANAARYEIFIERRNEQ